jgi:cell division protein FtsI (penicillin-binding protein 3)
MSYGHGISVSLLQLAQAYTIFTNDGEMKPVSFVKIEGPITGQQVISAETAREVRAMLEMVTQPGGTAPQAQILGYRVAGKTGTAHKVLGHNYAADRYVSSFVGFAPVSNPRLVIAAMIDEPNAGEYYGGMVAAPMFSKVMAGALRLLSVPPDIPLNQVLPGLEGVPVVREEV